MVLEADILNARIMVVDDIQSNIDLIESTLSSVGYTSLLSLTDPRKVSILFEGYNPDLVLLDLNMPYMDGFEVIENIKRIDGDTPPIIVITAQQDKETRLRALSSGARDFLTKPFDRSEILSRIRNMLEVRLLHNEIKNQNIILERKVQERTQELHETRLEIIRRLGQASEYRDNETGLHIVRMSKVSLALGNAAGMSDENANMLLQASPMHDVGKIGIPDSILLKPGKLDAAEWEKMKTHAEIGANLLDGHSSPLLSSAREIAWTHHEKWDGSGYPRGLVGEEIPIFGRICAIADVFDALTSVRPYKKAWTVEESVAEIKRLSGTHFDPHLTDIFLGLTDEIARIGEQYKDPS